MALEFKLAYDEVDEVEKLFYEYEKALIKADKNVESCLKLQSYDNEAKSLKEKYGLPGGRFCLAILDGQVAGCVGLRMLKEHICEMKRLFVRPTFRGQNIGDKLVKHIISEARKAGYKYMVLDTLPFLTAAIALYKKYGFYEIPAYNNQAIKGAIFMRIDLQDGIQ